MAISRRGFVTGAGSLVLTAALSKAWPMTVLRGLAPADVVNLLISGGTFTGQAFQPHPATPATVARAVTNGTASAVAPVGGNFLLQRGTTNFVNNAGLSGGAKGVLGAGGRMPTDWKIGGSERFAVEILDLPPSGMVLRITSPAPEEFLFVGPDSSANRNATVSIQPTLDGMAKSPPLTVNRGGVGVRSRMQVVTADPGFLAANMGVGLYSSARVWLRPGAEWASYAGRASAAGADGYSSDVAKVDRPRVWLRAEPGQFIRPSWNIQFSEPNSSATVQLGCMSVEDASSSSDVTDYTPATRPDRDLLVSIPSNSTAVTFTALLVGVYASEWRDGLSATGGWVRVPAGVGFAQVQGVYVFEGVLAGVDKAVVQESINPAASSFREPAFGIVGGVVHVREGLTSGSNSGAGDPNAGFGGLKARKLVTQNNASMTPFHEANNRSTLQKFQVNFVPNAEARPARAELMGRARYAPAENVVLQGDGSAARSVPFWTAFWLKVENDALADWEIYGQWHGNQQQVTVDAESGQSKVVGIEPVMSFGSGARSRFFRRFVVTWRSIATDLDQAAGHQAYGHDPALMTPLPPAGSPGGVITHELIDPVPLLANTWTHVVSRTVFAKDGSGECQVWRDGRPLLGMNGDPANPSSTPVGYNESLGPAFNHGIYSSATTLLKGVPRTTASYLQNVQFSGLQWGSSIVDQTVLPVRALVLPSSVLEPSTLHEQMPRS